MCFYLITISNLLSLFIPIDGLSGMFTLLVITRKRSSARRVATMISFFMRFTALAQSRPSGRCTTISTLSMRSCPTLITCFSRRASNQNGKTLTIEREVNGLSHFLSKRTWKKSAVRPG
jgi:hypothetical protein